MEEVRARQRAAAEARWHLRHEIDFKTGEAGFRIIAQRALDTAPEQSRPRWTTFATR